MLTPPQSITDPAAFDDALLRLPRPHILQTSHWAAVKAPVWRAEHFVWGDTAQPLAAATRLTRRIGPLPLRIQYVPKGPIAPEDEARWASLLSWLETETRRSGALFCKIDPDIDEESPWGQQIIQVLKARGWVYSGDQIQFRATLLSDLAGEEDALLAGMKQKTRYNVRLSERKGVNVHFSDDFSAFYRLYAETSARDGFIIRPESYYQVVMKRMQSHGLGQLLLATLDSEIIAGVFLMRFGPTAWYFYGASSAQHRDVMPNYLLQWRALQWAKAQGCAIYDWWGAPAAFDENDPMWGVYRFKEGFGARRMSWIGAWDYAPMPALYRIYTQLMPRLLAQMRRNAKQNEPGA